MKQLKSMEGESLLSSKSYGLATDILWQLADNKTTKQFGYTAPPLIHALFYDHERIRGDIFTSLYSTNLLQEWAPEALILKNKADALIWFADVKMFLEIEMGSQNRQKLVDKIAEYREYWLKGQEKFEVLFAMADQEAVDKLLSLFEESRVPYLAVVQNEFITDPQNCPLYSRLKVWTLTEIVKSHFDTMKDET